MRRSHPVSTLVRRYTWKGPKLPWTILFSNKRKVEFIREWFKMLDKVFELKTLLYGEFYRNITYLDYVVWYYVNISIYNLFYSIHCFNSVMKFTLSFTSHKNASITLVMGRGRFDCSRFCLHWEQKLFITWPLYCWILQIKAPTQPCDPDTSISATANSTVKLF